MTFVFPVDHKTNEIEKLHKYQDLAWELKKAMEYKADSNNNHSWNPQNHPDECQKEAEEELRFRKVQEIWGNFLFQQ